MILDGREIKKGDKLFCICNGWVSYLYNDYSDIYVDRGDAGSPIRYTANGTFPKTRFRALYWDIPLEPKPPKPKVKKWQWILKTKDGKHKFTENHYSKEEMTGPSEALDIVVEPYLPSEVEVEA